jgi:hypothetical protein
VRATADEPEPEAAPTAASLPASPSAAPASSDALEGRAQAAAADHDAERVALAERAKRLGAWLEELAVSSSCGTAGFLRILGGSAVAAEASYMAFHRDSGSDRWERGALSSALLAFGVLDIVGGIYCLTGPDLDQERVARWRALGNVDAVTLARFEGELAAQAAFARTLRLMGAVNGFGMAAGGALTLGLTPLSKLHGNAATFAYIASTVFVVFGLWDGISGLVGVTPSERAYRRYTQGESVERSALRVRVTPMLATAGAGLALDARF